MVNVKYFILGAALALGACAQVVQDPEPTRDATEVERIVFRQNARFHNVCMTTAPNSNPNLSLSDLVDRCQCFENWVVDNFDGKVVAWAVQYRDWWDRPLPAWAQARLSVEGRTFAALTRGAFNACGLKTVD